VPLIAEAFLAEASRVLMAAPALASLSEVETQLAGLPPVAPLGAAVAEYDEWVSATLAKDVWRDFYERADGHGARFALHTILEALLPFGTEDPPKTQLGIRVPIGAASSFAVALWVDIVRRSGAIRRSVPSFFWSPWWAAGAPRALVSLGEPHPSCLLEAAVGTGDTDVLCDLTSAEPAPAVTQRYRPMHRDLDAGLRAEDAAVSEILEALARPSIG
jgi:hypothetical protein